MDTLTTQNKSLLSQTKDGDKIHKGNNYNNNYEEINFRSSLAQVLATIGNSMMFMTVGMMVGVSTMVNGALHNNTQSTLCLNDDQASWFGSLIMLLQPAGSLVSGFLQKYIGRKAGMLLMNIPALMAWVLLYTGQSVEVLYVSVILMGLSAGFMEAPGLAYIGEITQPRMRGVMTSFANINVSVGMLLEFLLGSIVDWRTAVGLSAFFPVLSIMVICFIPDSPVWLLSKGRNDEGLKALQWLRGWVSEDKVKAEFEYLKRYTEASKLPKAKHANKDIYIETRTQGYVNASGVGVTLPTTSKSSSWKEKFFYSLRPAMMRPMKLVVGYQIIFHAAALSGLRPYIIEIFSNLGMPIDPKWIAFISAGVMLLGGIVCIVTVPWVGKRKLSLISIIGCSAACLLLGVYSQYKDIINTPWILLMLFCFLYFMTMVGIGPIPWMLISEVFPCSGRSLGASISAAVFYIVGFIFSKTSLNLLNLVKLHGCFYIYGLIGVFGIFFLYFYLPETEGKTLAQVENDFLDKKRQNKRQLISKA